MKKSARVPVAALAAALLLALTSLVCSASAQQPTGSADVKPEVPNNPTEHAPPVQPIPYSHKKHLHLAVDLPCSICHTNPAPGNLMTFPAATTCMSCHTSIATNKYSHKKHLALGLQCSICHTNPERGDRMTFPATTICMSCHTSIDTNKPAIQKLASFAKSRQPVPWVRVYTVLPGVTWTHRKHLAAGMKCRMCHGQVSEMETMSEATSVTAMGVCLHCHQLHNAPNKCEICHVWP